MSQNENNREELDLGEGVTVIDDSLKDNEEPKTKENINDIGQKTHDRVSEMLGIIQKNLPEKTANKTSDFHKRLETLKKSGTGNIPDTENSKEIPAHLLANKEEVEKDLPIHEKGQQLLDKFFQSADKPYNLFHIDRTLTENELKERIGLLDELYTLYKNSDSNQRDHLEELTNRMFDTPHMNKNLQDYLDHLDSSSSIVKSAGAENQNLIHVNAEMKAQVLKISKERHDSDFTSILKLMKNMHILMLRLNKDYKVDENMNVNIRLLGQDMMIYKDADLNYKRMIRQPYAKGKSIKFLTDQEKNDPNFRKAWKFLLEKIEEMKKTDGIVLDITDSKAPKIKQALMAARGNVANTENIFVNKEKNDYTFSIIDPDVFDTIKGEHKFDPKEYARMGKGWLTQLKIKGMNFSRDSLVIKQQDKFSKKEREK